MRRVTPCGGVLLILPRQHLAGDEIRTAALDEKR